MRTDQHGNLMTTTSDEAVVAYDSAVDHLLHFRSEVSPAAESVLAHDPTNVMGHVANAYLGILGTEPTDTANACAELTEFEGSVDLSKVLPRERMHLAAAHALVHGELYAGAGVLRDVAREYPRDALALAVGHQIDFFTGDAATLRDRVGGALTAWTASDVHYPQLLGMYSFGLEESGMYARAEDVGLESVDRDADDVWGIHAVAHTFEMQGRIADGIRFLEERSTHWQEGNFLNVHNSWHYCLYLLDSGDTDKPLQIYDRVIHNAESEGLAMEMLDAAALLWRMHLEGIDQSGRWTVLAAAWEETMETPHYAFNDMHAVMSYIGAGRFDDAERLVGGRQQYVADHANDPITNVTMTREVGLAVDRALIAFGRGDYRTSVDLLFPIRATLNRFGGSHAQRDAVQRTLLEAALRSGQNEVARLLLSERLGINPCSPYGWLKKASLSRAVGDAVSARDDAARAAELRTMAVASP